MSDKRLKFDEAILRICNYTNLDNRNHREYIPCISLLPREMHTLEKIILHPGINTTKLAQITGIPKGTISKMTREFQLRKLIDCFKDDSNRKEVYYRGTETGLKVFNAHIEFHKIVGYEFYSYFDSLPEESKDAVIDVLCRYSDYMKDLCEKTSANSCLRASSHTECRTEN